MAVREVIGKQYYGSKLFGAIGSALVVQIYSLFLQWRPAAIPLMEA